MGALPATKTPICDIPHLVGIPAPEHLRYQAVIVASIVPRVHALEAIPVVGQDLFEEVPGRRSCCSHQAASLQSVGWWVIALFYHIPSMTSTPSAVLTRVLPPPRSPLHHGDVRAIAKWKILCYRGKERDHLLHRDRLSLLGPHVHDDRRHVLLLMHLVFERGGTVYLESGRFAEHDTRGARRALQE